MARNFGAQQIIVCASPAYLAQQGRPTAPDQLGRHRCLVFRMPSTGRVRPWDFVVAGAPLAFTPKSTATFNDGEALVAAAAADMGLIQVPDYMAEDEMRAGRLVEVLKSSRPPPTPLSVVYASSRQVPPRLRAFLGVITAKE